MENNRKFRDGDHVCFGNSTHVGVIDGVPYRDNKLSVLDTPVSYYVVTSYNHSVICNEKDLRHYTP